MKLYSSKMWRSLGFKIFTIFFITMIVSVSLMGYLSYKKSTEIIDSNMGKVSLQTIQQANRRMETIFQEYNNRSFLIFGNLDIQKGILNDFNDTYERAQNTKKITSFLANLVNVNNDIVSVYLLGSRDFSYRYSVLNTPTVTEIPSDPEQQEKDWYKEIVKADGRVVWFGIQNSFMQEDNKLYEKTPVFCYGRAIKDINNTGKVIGVMLLEIAPAAVTEMLKTIDFNMSGFTFLIRDDNTIVANSEPKDMMRPSGLELLKYSSGIKKIKYEEKQMVMVYDMNSINGWKMVGMVPEDVMLKDSNKIRMYTMYLILSLMIVSVILALLAARQIQKPVYVLVHSMRKAREGQFDVQIQETRQDEFGILYESFNIMVYRIKSLIDELYVQQLLKKELQLKMMGSQINAHFLYNTLDSIHWISRIHKVDKISTMIFGLSNYLRISLNTGKDEVTIRESVELVESYISIQKHRYEDKFHVQITADPQLYNYNVLKFVFQPLVENAIYHGLENKKGHGSLHIRWIKEGDKLYFEVADDGVGIAPGKLSEIKQMLITGDAAGDNFALHNIHAQIQLTYGHDYGLNINSEKGKGTVVSITMPLN